ncbi:hypothetical protein J4429_00600 [Candidatus Pacearchaeota archaeon]|nr:hypothetical protein [uncultured archaeon]AQS32536.1 hypothetical protein [uncultured archaeon]AQS33094.1 hypothetical protein [uncultured archaeon]MBS3074937.1 hypothetical protein [Candidatus Pacearchaeota archaeon]
MESGKCNDNKDFYDELINLRIDRKAKNLYILSEKDRLKEIRVTMLDLEIGVLREYRCRN